MANRSPSNPSAWPMVEKTKRSRRQKGEFVHLGDLSSKSHGVDSESSSISSSNLDLLDRHEGETDQISPESMVFNYKCSLCDYQSNISWNVQKHLNDKHAEQSNAYVFTQCRQTKSSSHDVNQPKSKSSKQKNGNGQHRSLSPASALAKAKFSPIVEEALLSLQGSRLNPHLYAVQPKFGIKRLKCRHCFYRSNWKTDMIRHVRIRHNLTEPDHHKGKDQRTSLFLWSLLSLPRRYDYDDWTRSSFDDWIVREHFRQRTSSTDISDLEWLGQSRTGIHSKGWFSPIRKSSISFSLRSNSFVFAGRNKQRWTVVDRKEIVVDNGRSQTSEERPLSEEQRRGTGRETIETRTSFSVLVQIVAESIEYCLSFTSDESFSDCSLGRGDRRCSVGSLSESVEWSIGKFSRSRWWRRTGRYGEILCSVSLFCLSV